MTSRTPPPLPQPPGSRPRSSLVTALAWLLIVASALATPLGIVFGALALPGLTAGWNIGTIAFVVMVTVPPLSVVAGVGLLRRRNWARLGVLLLLVASLAFTAFELARMALSAGGDSLHDGMQATMLVIDLVYALPVFAVQVFLVVTLCSRAVRAEFRRSPDPDPGLPPA